MPTAANDVHLLPEQETPLVIGKTLFLDHDISAGGFVDTGHVSYAAPAGLNIKNKKNPTINVSVFWTLWGSRIVTSILVP